MKRVPAETDFLVIGAGVAGLRAAIELAEAGRVVVLAKREAGEAAVAAHRPLLSDEDDISLHLQDTLSAGDGLCNVEAVKMLLEEAPERIEELISWAASHHPQKNKLMFTREGAGGRNRVLHATDETVGRAMLHALLAKARATKNISIYEFEFVTELQVEDGRVCGVSLIDEKGLPEDITASAVLLANGGLGQIYRNTTNPTSSTADGVALALSAGAAVSDMEFIQFHPTTLYLKKAPPFLLSEALLGGAYLRNLEMIHFMPKYHPMAELAPHDVVARAIMHEMEVMHTKDPVVYLDLTRLNGDHLRKRFPRIHATCMEYNIDLTTDLIPVRPAAHYAVGGVRADLEGRTSLSGLYAAGETAMTGLHGANRLPGNSLLEALVFGARAGKGMRQEIKRPPMKSPRPRNAATSNGPVDAGLEELVAEIQNVMWNDVGIVRMGSKLKSAVQHLEKLSPRLDHPRTRRAHEARHLHLTALLVARSALAREESRGAHYRMDFPTHNDAKFLKHSVLRGERIEFV